MTVYNQDISTYITNMFAQEDETLAQIRIAIPEKGLPEISITPEEGQFLHVLVRACQARLALEIGTLGGYSGTWIARGLKPYGKLITIEKSAKHAQVARAHFMQTGVSQQTEIHIGDAHQVLPKLINLAPFDFVFIDAEKPGYPFYFDWSVENLRLGGIITVHNALWGGSVVSDYQGEAVNEVKSFNSKVAQDKRVASTIFPAGDGTLVAVRTQ